MAAFEAKQKAYAEIEARFACAHTDRKICHRIIKDGRTTYVSQCLRCGHTSSPIKAAEAKRSGATIPEYDEHKQEKWHRAKSLAYETAQVALKPQLKAEYKAYLQSPEWRALRLQVFDRCEGICEVCEDTPAIEVHHLTYERIGKEELLDLLGVCESCHRLIHGERHT